MAEKKETKSAETGEAKKQTGWKIATLVALILLAVVSVLYALGVGWKKSDDKAVTEAASEVGTDGSSEDAGASTEAGVAETKGDPLSLWTAGAKAKDQLKSYMEDITNEASENFIPVENRIAVFDLDGTLCSETNPTYFDYSLLMHRVLEDPDYVDKASDFEKEVASRIYKSIEGEKVNGLEVDHGKAIASSFAGMTLDEFDAYVKAFRENPAPGYEGMTRGESFYKPMLEIIDYLQANGFTVFIVSGTDRLIVRGLVDGAINVPMSQVIGSDETLVASNQGTVDGLDYLYTDDDSVVLGGEFIIKNLKMNKVSVIAQEIGEQPVLSFGNSTGDSSMAKYVTSNNKYKSLAFMLCCDDTEREYGNEEKAEKMVKICEENDWIPISMKNDWTTIYGDGVKKTQGTAPNPFKLNGDEPEKEAEKKIIGPLSKEGYSLEQVVVLSRHNMRAPLSDLGSELDICTPNEWYDWSSKASELSLRGGTLETEMGQYFRKWLEQEELFPENYQPEDGAVRIYANSKQRTIATAQFFSAGLLPANNTDVETHAEFDTMDPVFTPAFTYMSDDYAKDVEEEINKLYKEEISGLADNYDLIKDVIDFENSDAYTSGKIKSFDTADTKYSFEEGKEPALTGSLKTACSISDALVLQYYEMDDPLKAAFGHKLSDEQWKEIAEVKDVYVDALYASPLVAANIANPLVKEIKSELNADGRRFSFLCGHDSNLTSVLAALGAEDWELPDAVEKTPIGSKLVFAKWKNEAGEEFISVDLVYQKTEQLRGLSLLDTENPPGVYGVSFKGISANEDGLFKADDILKHLDDVIDDYDTIVEDYEMDEAA
ncbi:MAG: histidine-type phosphatase [Lachnospiraceae bacterium]|nr:histidine-type phosphatase [Lachnospiraceae bacterium]